MAELLEKVAMPQVAMAFMNHVHAEEAELVSVLNEWISRQQSGEFVEARIDTSVELWRQHTVEHFERENRLMQEFRFPAAGIHIEEHDRALAALHRIQKDWLAARDINVLAEHVQINWPQWFQRHIATMDTVTAIFFQQSGMTG